MEALRCKRVSHPAYSPDLAIVNFYLFGKIKEKFRTMQASSKEEFVEAVIDILGRIPRIEKCF
jgi:hypothetical protein